MIKFFILLFVGFLSSTLSQAQYIINLWKTATHQPEYINILPGQNFSIQGDILFQGSNAPPRYSPGLDTIGIHFRNLTNNIMENNILLEANVQNGRHASPNIGVHGQNTVLAYKGVFRGDNDFSKTSIVLSDSGRFVVAKEAHIDLVFPTFNNYTRQLWISGDGTGIFEIEKGFKADRSENGTQAKGFGSIRLSNTLLITHDSAGLPAYFRPENADPTSVKINSHLVFENKPGSLWQIKTQNQNFIGGIFVKQNMTLETQKNLTLSGVITKWDSGGFDPYTNYGGLSFMSPNRTFTKKGRGKFLITGDITTAPNSSFRIEDGETEIRKDPYTERVGIFGEDNQMNGQNLRFLVDQKARLVLSATVIRIKLLQMLHDSAVLSAYCETKILADSLVLKGKLLLLAKGNENFQAGAEYTVFLSSYSVGRFSQVILPDPGIGNTWDTTKLYSEGKIKVINPTKIKYTLREIIKVNIFPNPAKGVFYISTGEDTECAMYNFTGELVWKAHIGKDVPLECREVSDPGMYCLVFTSGKMRVIKTLLVNTE